MSWLSNVIVVGTPVDGIAAVKIPLPGSNMALVSSLDRQYSDGLVAAIVGSALDRLLKRQLGIAVRGFLP